MAKVFVLTGARAGQSVRLMEKYVFVDGVMVEESDEAAKLKADVILSMYPCEMMDYEVYRIRQEEAKALAASKASAPTASAPAPGPVQTAASEPSTKVEAPAKAEATPQRPTGAPTPKSG